MDLSPALKRLSHKLIREPVESVGIQQYKSHESVTIGVSASINRQKIEGAGTSKSVGTSYLKALSEVGEGLICLRGDVASSNGLASGLFTSTATFRAKNELIERDAFLFHYRKRIPWRPFSNNKELCLFKLSSADPGISIVLAVEPALIAGEAQCFIFGMGAHLNQSHAIEKAKAEFRAMKSIHELKPKRCEEMAALPQERLLEMDIHHVASRDRRNLARLRKLATEKSTWEERSIDPTGFSVKKLDSPITMLKYVAVKHPQLMHLPVGTPEPDSKENRPLYHPFW